MKLKFGYFTGVKDMVDFVNENYIQKDNIQELIRIGTNLYCLFYWE